MKGARELHHSDSKPVFLLACIIGALCFSAGEGLRLTPFPANNVAGITAQEHQLANQASGETSTTKYGPVDLPKRTQARSKHKVFDVESLSAVFVINPSPRFFSLAGAGEASKVASLQLISDARDRAPPLFT